MGRSRIVDQIVYSRPFLRAEIEDRVFVSFKTMRYPQIIVIFIAKTHAIAEDVTAKTNPATAANVVRELLYSSRIYPSS